MKGLTFLGMEFHKPILFPLLKSIQVKLKVTSIKLSLYSSVLNAIIANNMAVDPGDMYSSRSFINRRKSRGPRTLPWAPLTGLVPMMK